MKWFLEKFYHVRGIMIAPPYLFLLLVSFYEYKVHAVVWPLGLLIFALGVGVRVWAQIHLHYRLKVHKVLTMTGPYALVRNPIYIANTLMMVGVTVLSELLWFVPVMLVWCIVVYNIVIRREEGRLAEKYGTPYLDYLKSTPRWFPRLHLPVQPMERPGWRQYLFSSLIAESHCLLFLLPLIAKEWWV